MGAVHMARALRAVALREIIRFFRQRGRLLSGLVRPLLWLVVFGAGFSNVFGVSIIPPYTTYVTYQTYMAPGLVGIVLLFNGMLSSLAMVYDREMGMMRLLLTAPLPRWTILLCKLLAGAALSMIQAYAFLATCLLFDVDLSWMSFVWAAPAIFAGAMMTGATGLLLSVYVRQMENFAGAMNFVIFPMFFISSALYPLWKLQESGAYFVWLAATLNPFTYAVELVRHSFYGLFDPLSALVVSATTGIFFMIAAIGYDPQNGLMRRARHG
jgi:ABC-2 type transport system permease protein